MPVKIFGKFYSIKDDTTEVDPQRLADYVDSKMREISQAQKAQSPMDLAILAALNITQELIQVKNQLESKNNQQKERTLQIIEMLDKAIENIEK